jgi:hypothetical protein
MITYRTPVGYTEEFRRDHAARSSEQEREQAARDATNAAAVKARLASIEADREAERAAADAIDEQSIAPDKARVMREWLSQDASRTESQFNQKAWPQLRLNILEEKRAAAFEQQKERMRANRGRYTLR